MLSFLFITVPGFPQIKNTDISPDFNLNLQTLGGIISALLNIAFYIAGFLAFYYLVWGAFQYMASSGNKEQLQKARARITWALVGLIVVFMSYFIARFASEIFKPGKGGLPF